MSKFLKRKDHQKLILVSAERDKLTESVDVVLRTFGCVLDSLLDEKWTFSEVTKY